MNIYFVRHGESELNKSFTHQGPDTPLSKDGLKQAKAVADRLKNIKIDFIYTSPYRRAIQTAEIISKNIGKPIEFWDELHEMKIPSVLANLRFDSEKSKKVRKQIEENYHKGNWKYSDEENYKDMKVRAQQVLNHLLEKHKNEDVLCISHSTIIKMIVTLAILDKLHTPKVFWQFRQHSIIGNTGITHLKYTDGYGWNLVSLNDTTHL